MLGHRWQLCYDACRGVLVTSSRERRPRQDDLHGLTSNPSKERLASMRRFHGWSDMRISFAAAVCALLLLGLEAALAEDCSPHCEYWHYYGPYDFTYIQPGLFAYPVCDRQGTCSPHLVYTYSGHPHGRIIVHPKGPGTRPRS
jgi:hypothetical protein